VATEKADEMAKKEAIYMHPLRRIAARKSRTPLSTAAIRRVRPAENRLHTVKAILSLVMGGRP